MYSVCFSISACLFAHSRNSLSLFEGSLFAHERCVCVYEHPNSFFHRYGSLLSACAELDASAEEAYKELWALTPSCLLLLAVFISHHYRYTRRECVSVLVGVYMCVCVRLKPHLTSGPSSPLGVQHCCHRACMLFLYLLWPSEVHSCWTGGVLLQTLPRALCVHLTGGDLNCSVLI